MYPLPSRHVLCLTVPLYQRLVSHLTTPLVPPISPHPLQIPLPESDTELAVTSLGQLDAIATWFDLHLDEEVCISTSPLWDISWEQALFPMQRGMAVAPGNHLCLHSSCSDILLDVRLVGVASNTKTTPPPSVPFSFPRVDTLCQTKSALGSMQEDPPPTPPTTTPPVFYIERHEVCRLNDVLYMERYFCSIQEAILTARKEAWSGSESEEEMVCADMNGLCIGGGGEGQLGRSDEGGVANCLVLDLTHGPSLFGIAAAMKGTWGMVRDVGVVMVRDVGVVMVRDVGVVMV